MTFVLLVHASELPRDPSHTKLHMIRYKYYSDQTRLTLTADILEKVVALLPPTSQILDSVMGGHTTAPDAVDTVGHESGMKLLIKIFLDQYCEGNQAECNQLCLVFMEMLQSPFASCQARSFDLLLNIAVHSHLLEDIVPSFDNECRIQQKAGMRVLRRHQMLQAVYASESSWTIYSRNSSTCSVGWLLVA